MAILVMTVVTALLVKTFILDASYIPSRSMTDVLLPGDYVLVNKFLYGARTPLLLSGDHGPLPVVQFPALRDPRRGDILLFWLPSGTGPGGFGATRQFVKRCVAVPGDTLLIAGGEVRVNGRLAARLEGDTVTSMDIVLPRRGDTVVIGAGVPAILRGLVVRDRLLQGAGQRDGGGGLGRRSRDHEGQVSDSAAQPAAGDPADTHTVANEFYFVLGDRTSLSLDSRHWGLIPRAWVIGAPIAVYWSAEPGSPEGGFPGRLRGVRWSRIGHLVR